MVAPHTWNPVKELKVEERASAEYIDYLLWNPVKELKVYNLLTPVFHVKWNPVKELKAVLKPDDPRQRDVSVESGEGIERIYTTLRHFGG